MNNLIPLLDAYEKARGTSDCYGIKRDGTEAAESAYQTAIAAEESAVDAAIKELRALEPELTYASARGAVAIPAYRDRLRAQYGVI